MTREPSRETRNWLGYELASVVDPWTPALAAELAAADTADVPPPPVPNPGGGGDPTDIPT